MHFTVPSFEKLNPGRLVWTDRMDTHLLASLYTMYQLCARHLHPQLSPAHLRPCYRRTVLWFLKARSRLNPLFCSSGQPAFRHSRLALPMAASTNMAVGSSCISSWVSLFCRIIWPFPANHSPSTQEGGDNRLHTGPRSKTGSPI